MNKEEKNSYSKDYYQNNKDKFKGYRIKNKSKIAEYNKQYKLKNKEKLSAYRRLERVREKDREYVRTHSEERSKKAKIYAKENPEKVKEQRKRREDKIKNTPSLKIRNSLRARVRDAVKRKGVVKNKSTLELIGCSIDFLIKHLESLFLPGMTWDNYGVNGWHIDHIIPCALFDLTKEEEQKKCFNWSNLQPLWAIDNIKKGKKILI